MILPMVRMRSSENSDVMIVDLYLSEKLAKTIPLSNHLFFKLFLWGG
jgi:hypothetical protein